MKNFETEETSKKIKKTKEEIMKQLKELITSDENVNKDIKESVRKVKNFAEAAEIVKEMEKVIKSNKCSILWLAYQQSKIFEKVKAYDKFINMVNQFGISKSTTVFKISIVRFLNNYPKIKKSLLCLPFLYNNFKIKEIFQQNVSEFKWYLFSKYL